MASTVNKLRAAAEATETLDDSKAQIFKAVGKYSDEVLHALVLVAVYPGSKYHPGTTLLRTDKNLLEQKYQGNAGLVIAVGPGAFKDDKIAKFHGKKIEVGDWVVMRPSDGLAMNYKEWPCYLFEDVQIKIKIADPSIYY